MANPEHLAILKKGKYVWNRWVREIDMSEIQPDLSGADLSGRNLTGVDLAFANLKGSDFREADLTKADLTEADLSEANLKRASLSFANLTDALLDGANLMGANLTGTILKGAWFYDTVFSDVDLSHTKGLEECFHDGPSTIDHRTLLNSGPLPLKFLRGCGLPDHLIEYLPSLRNEPFQFYSCFISYSSKDQEFTDRLHADLQDKGVRCWFAPEDLKIGARTRRAIDESIRIHDKLLLILSKNSIKSDWVEKEVETAFEKERERKETVLFPIRLDDTVMKSKTGWAADIKRSRNIGDFCKWKEHDPYQKAFDRLLRDLKAEPAKK